MHIVYYIVWNAKCNAKSIGINKMYNGTTISEKERFLQGNTVILPAFLFSVEYIYTICKHILYFI